MTKELGSNSEVDDFRVQLLLAMLLNQGYEFRNSPAVYAHQAFPPAMLFGLFSTTAKTASGARWY